MDIWEVMRSRHSVRKYLNKPIEDEKAATLRAAIDEINAETGFHFALCLNEPDAFQGEKLHYGSFSGCRNYFALVAKKKEDEKVGYFGEKLVLLAQSLGLNTCWAALTYEKGKVKVPVGDDEKIYDLIALGYGENQGVQHRNKPINKVAEITDASPEWFKNGVEAAMLAPTAINQQQFYFKQTGEREVLAKSFIGPCAKTDLGIVKYHFELGAGKENFEWKK